MIKIKTQEEVELMSISAKLVSQTLAEIAKTLKAGMTTFDIDQFTPMHYNSP